MNKRFVPPGDIAGVDLFAALQAISHTRESGTARFENGEERFAFAFETGELTGVGSPEVYSPAELLIRAGKVRRETYSGLIVAAGESRYETALTAGVISRREAAWAGKMSAIESLNRLLSWAEGRYQFSVPADMPIHGGFRLSVERWILEFFLRSHDRMLVLHHLGATEVALAKVAGFEQKFAALGLTADADRVTGFVDGRATAEQIVKKSASDEFAVLKLLAALVTLGLIYPVLEEPEKLDEPFTPPPPEIETPPPSEPEALPVLEDAVMSPTGEPPKESQELADAVVRAPEPPSPPELTVPEPVSLIALTAPEPSSRPELAFNTERSAETSLSLEDESRRGKALRPLVALLILAGGAFAYFRLAHPHPAPPPAPQHARAHSAIALAPISLSPASPQKTTVPSTHTAAAPAKSSGNLPLKQRKSETEKLAPRKTAHLEKRTPRQSTRGSLAVMASNGERLFDHPRRGASYTIQIEIACEAATVHRALAAPGGSRNIWIVPHQFQGKSCYRVLWGRYSTRSRALAARERLPRLFFGLGNHPTITPLAPRKTN